VVKVRGVSGVPDPLLLVRTPLLKDETPLLQLQTPLLRTRTLYVTELGNERPVRPGPRWPVDLYCDTIISGQDSTATQQQFGLVTRLSCMCEGIEGEWLGEWERGVEEMEWGS